MNHDDLVKIFPDIAPSCWDQLGQYAELMREWNAKINLVSRKDIDAFEVHHIAHCLAITPKLKLMKGARLLDVGTGGGLPGIPLAIVYPQAHFFLVDSVAKKLRVVEDMVKRLKLKNVNVKLCRAEDLKSRFDFVLGRAVTKLPNFCSWIKRKLLIGRKHSLDNGLLYWKGGDVDEELASLGVKPEHTFKVQEVLPDEYFSEKYIFHFLAQDIERVRNISGVKE